MLSYNESLKILKETNALLEGHFILSSGLHSNQYVQCAKLLSYPKQAEIICAALTEKIKSNFNKIDIVLSPALGGIVVGYEIAKQLNTQTIFAERSNNKLVLRRGFAIPQDSNVLIVEDVITTGKSAIECSEIVKINKANLIGFACVIDRSDNNVLIKEKIVSQIKIKIAIFKENELPDELKKTPAVKPGSRNLSNDQN
jgi:orotate phosphoribosyltransferase